jgi:hypothetical protein
MVQQSQDDLTDMILEQGSMHRLTQLLPNNQGFFHSSSTQGFRFRKCTHGISQRQTQTPRSMDRGVHGFLRTKHRPSSLNRNYTQVSCRLAYTLSLRQSGRNGCEPPSRLTTSVLFACTRVDTCHPGNCMRSIRTPSSHHLGNHVSFQKDLG